VARILIVGGGCRGRRLSARLAGEGHAVRITTRRPERCSEIEAAGAECWLGTPDRLSTLRGALDGVTVACWLLGCASGPPDRLAALHGTRLELFLAHAVDTTARGFVYEARGTVGPVVLGEGLRVAREITERNRIPAAWLEADPADPEAWLGAARAAIASLLDPARTSP
jgi:hypothetical protein